MKNYYFAGTQNDLEQKIDDIGCSVGTNVTFQPERTSKQPTQLLIFLGNELEGNE